jgi:hypothetical protein
MRRTYDAARRYLPGDVTAAADLALFRAIGYIINMVRRILLFLAFAVPLALAGAQEEDPQDGGEPPQGTFPVSLLLEAAETASGGGPLWRPGWPPDISPDVFSLRGEKAGMLLSVEVSILPADSPDQGDQRVYRFSRDREGRAEAFPFLLDGELFQAEFSYNGDSLAAAIILKGPGETEPLSLKVLEWEDSRPFLIRVVWGGRYSFVLIQKNPGGILEAWYDTEGLLFEVYDFTTTPQAAPGAAFQAASPAGGRERIVSWRLRGKGEEERYSYDSRGLVTGVSGPRGDFSVLYYLEDLPRYLGYYPALPGPSDPADPASLSDPSGREDTDVPPPLSYSLRWDEKTFRLLGLSGKAPGEDLNSVDCGYAYTLDKNGNWIERREIRMIRRLGLLAPSPGTTIRRVLEYGEEE